MIRGFDHFLLDAGYGRLQTPGKESTVYFQNQGQFTSVIHLMYIPVGIPLLPDSYLQIKNQLVKQFQDKGFDEVHILTLVVSEDVPMVRALVEKDEFSWIIDKANTCLEIPEGHVEDFYGLKRIVLACLEGENPFGWDEETEVLPPKEKIPLRKQSFINYGIILINFFLFLLCIVAGDLIYQIGILYPEEVVEHGKWYEVITSIFLHADVDHLFGNMILLFCLGSIAEKKLGHVKYFIIYMASGIAGNLLSILYSYMQEDFVGSLGASGAVYGIVGTFLWILFCHKGKVGDVTIARYIFVFAYSLYLGFTSTNVNNVAHIGGLLAGILLGILLYRHRREHS